MKIGRGGFAKVYRAIEVHTNLEVAVKVVEKNHFSASQIEKVYQEIEIQKKLNHEGIARIYEVIETEAKIYIFQELCQKGELFDYINSHGPLPEKLAANIFQQIYEAVCYLHSKGIAHRDIKTENILLTHDLKAKLIDFGLSNTYKEN